MKKLFARLFVLALLTFGIFFTAFDKASAAYTPNCQECFELQNECNLYCENGGPGCTWCTNRLANCFRICTW